MRRGGLLISLALGAGLVLALLWLSGGPPARASAVAQSDVFTVCPGGGCDYETIQEAVNAAGDGDRIKVAAGVYTQVNSLGGLAQVLYLTETVTVQGGFYPGAWDQADPEANPTTLDAEGRGRVVTIAGGDPTLTGLRITGGDANGLGGSWGDSGGGVYVPYSSAVISGCRVFSNSAEVGGGLFLNGDASLLASMVYSNTADVGGGLHIFNRPLLANNVVAGNHARNWGGAIYIDGRPRLLHTTIAGNTSPYAAGVYADYDSRVVLTNTILVGHAVGVYVAYNSAVTLTATLWGSGDWANDVDWQGSGQIVTGSLNLWGDPAFAAPGAGDYRITAASRALDAGVDAGLDRDLDGDPRPMRGGNDIGADELPPLPRASFFHSSPDWLGQATVFTNTTPATVTTGYLWAFGDGLTSTLKSPVHAYAGPGEHAVTLTATNQAGSHAVQDRVTVYGLPQVDFSAHPTMGVAPLAVTFVATATTLPPGDPTVILWWTFGDGGGSAWPTPTHVYSATGRYTVTLSAGNAAGTAVLTRLGYINARHGLYLPLVLWDW